MTERKALGAQSSFEGFAFGTFRIEQQETVTFVQCLEHRGLDGLRRKSCKGTRGGGIVHNRGNLLPLPNNEARFVKSVRLLSVRLAAGLIPSLY